MIAKFKIIENNPKVHLLHRFVEKKAGEDKLLVGGVDTVCRVLGSRLFLVFFCRFFAFCGTDLWLGRINYWLGALTQCAEFWARALFRCSSDAAVCEATIYFPE